MTDVLAAPLPFALDLPTRIRFGRGSRAALPEILAAYGRDVALVSGQSFARNPAASPLGEAIAGAGLAVRHITVGHGEPDTVRVLELARTLQASGVAVVAAVGGGSVLDLVKASALLPDAASLDRWLLGERVDSARGIPVIAVPTTAGSGAEVSHGAIILDRAARRKRGIRGPGVAAAVALVDPDLTLSADAAVTSASGFDALAHAVETSASRAATSLNVTLAGIAFRHLVEGLPRAIADPRDPETRQRIAYAALLMGINLASSTTCLPHRLQYPLGAITSTGHARGVAALMPAWLDRTARVAPAALGRLAVAAGLVAEGSGAVVAAHAVVGAVTSHIDATGMRVSLQDLGLKRSDIPTLVAAVEGSVANDPGPAEPDDLATLLEASYSQAESPWMP